MPHKQAITLSEKQNINELYFIILYLTNIAVVMCKNI